MEKFKGLSIKLPSATENILKQVIDYGRVKDYKVISCDESYILVECEWIVHLGSRDVEKGKSEKGVRSIEPVCWHIPFNFPKEPIAPSLRADFPRAKFPHINPSQKKDVVSPCITENDITSFLLANGLQNLFRQMDSWLDRAAQDRLMVEGQGWEPILFDNYGGSFIDINGDVISSAKVVAFKQSATTRRVESKGSFHTYSNSPLYISVKSDGSLNQPIDILYLCLPESTSSKQYQHLPVNNRNELISFAESLDGTPDVSSNTIVLLSAECSDSEWLKLKLEELDRKAPQLKTNRSRAINPIAIGCVVVFCIPRSINLIGGTSNIEVVPFFVRLTAVHNDNPEVFPLSYIQGVSSEILQKVSHSQSRPEKNVAFLGAGSVGSKIAMSLARSGSYSTFFIDNGTFRPHNMARYGISHASHYEGVPKAFLLNITVKNLCIESGFRLDNLSKGQINLPEHTEVIIESTGNELVSFNLSSQTSLPGRVYQVGLYGQSSMGYLAIEPSSKLREVRIDDIEAMMYSLSLHEPEIAAALYERKSAERQLVGYGCSSETTIMPDTSLSLCCAAITEKIDKSIYQENDNPDFGELHLCFKRDDCAITWKSYPIPPTKQIAFVYEDRSWNIRLSGIAARSMYQQQKDKLPNETGGAIIGYICELTGRVYVTEARPPFRASVESPGEFTFNQLQLRELDKDIREASNGRVYVVGTWHSHTAPSAPSNIDKTTLNKLNGNFKLPVTIMLMCDGQNIVAVQSMMPSPKKTKG